jgi:hypothetical protein
LHHFEQVYAAMVRNCLCRDLVNEEGGVVEPGRVSGWEWILEDWWMRVRRQAVGRDGGEVPTLRLHEVIDQTITAIRRRWSVHAAFGEALRQLALSRSEGDEHWSQVMRSWFKGEDVHSVGGQTRARLRSAGIRESLNRKNAKEMLRSMSAFLRYCGFNGVLILIDELENVLHQPPTARRTSYTILRELIDNIDDRHGMTHAAFYISATPDVFDSAKGMVEYEALAERVLLSGARNPANPAAAVIDLAAWPLRPDEMLEMSERIAGLYGVAKNWKPDDTVTEHFSQLLKQNLSRQPTLTARDWVKAVVDELDVLAGRA